MKKSALAIELS